ncbi:type II secretion system inner membrane protein GspF [Xanthomonas nasturtii]|uniref:Type II secretion system protein GspF n=1 Tax=Xanthomonas nasturtii TaxID=1843581 RepID=A0A3E1KRE0_9XANT|nr:type II secretion system inner membrane protein GspF [Xanthomonas nasturtii]MCL1529545.1 type II secretion system inner membrane protein GspF [Xanthomonas nasturtii]MCL1564454.1 type II secretion system inner membrane protein GspF [Xanthomonas nasturtii]MCL1568313.1 type II secretion system inner membrane protein GspF [Xanthomonas nasturtii]MCL1572132.1 type II secretion system inner membrane protein GspF [Xanthomonas nasturtii]MCL1579968.1 type II secretion system inner membrane protein Gs
MPQFDYTVLDLQGRNRHGVISADSVHSARARLEQRQWVPVRVEAAAATAGTAVRAARFSGKDLVLFTRQLSTLVETAPLEEALRTIGTQSERRGVRQVTSQTHALVLEGFRLSDAMARQGKAFPALYRAMVAAGESAGALPQVLERLADLLERQAQVRSELQSALVYPAALALTAGAVVIVLMTFVVPKVVDQFDSMGRALPWLTRAVIGVSQFLLHAGIPLLIALAVAAVAALHMLKRPALRLAADRALLRAPLLGRLIRDLHAARMARTLAIMVNSGLPLMEGLMIAARTVDNRALRLATDSMVTAIREGGSLAAAMKRAGVFPPTLLYMASSGENSGRLAPMLERAADYLEREFASFTTAAMSLLEPAIIVLLGGVVAVIVLSILLPILQFNTLALG